MDPVYTDAQLSDHISNQYINGRKIHYCLVDKVSQSGWSNNQRLFFFDEGQNIIYYTYKTKAPFKVEQNVPKAKQNKYIVGILQTQLKVPASTSNLQIKFSAMDKKASTIKNSTVNGSWVFTFKKPQIAQQFFNLIKEAKEREMNKITNKTYSNINNNKTTSNIKESSIQKRQNKTFVQDTIAYGLDKSKNQSTIKNSPKKEQPLKTSTIRPQNKPINEPSKISSSAVKPQKQPQKMRESYTKPLYESKPNNVSESNLRASNMSDSKINPYIEQLARSNLQRSKRQSQVREGPPPATDLKNDWNYRFYKQLAQSVIQEFEIAATKAFMSIYEQDKKNGSEDLRIYETMGLQIIVTSNYTPQSSHLKDQFRNYHFILESTREKFIIGVPLASFIQFQGTSALVKAPIHPKAKPLQITTDLLNNIKDLQRYTRIQNEIIAQHNNCDIYDLTQVYGNNKNIPKVIYLDRLKNYLPYLAEQSYNCSVRSDYILDNVTYFIQGGKNSKNSIQLTKKIQITVKNLAVFLSNQEFLFTNIIQLKTLMHANGINLKFLPDLYRQVSNKSVKKYIHTCMVAKIIKDQIITALYVVCRDDQKYKNSSGLVEEMIKVLMEGGTNASNQRWKKISYQFKKQFKIMMNSHEIVPGFLLNSIMSLVCAQYDQTKLNQKKILLKDQDIINEGFVRALKPKVKSYWRFTTDFTEAISKLIKQSPSRRGFEHLVKQLELQKRPLPQYLDQSWLDRKIYQYLANYIPPHQFSKEGQSFKHLQLYASVNNQPPTDFSFNITKLYLQSAIKTNQLDHFEQIVKESLRLVDYWLDQYHPYTCDFLDCMAQYLNSVGDIQSSINVSKQSLIICIKSGSKNNKKLGQKSYILAEKQMKIGRKADALENLTKAKESMEQSNSLNVYYPSVLMNISLLNLNSGNIDKSIEYALLAEKNFDNLIKNKQNPQLIQGKQQFTEARQIKTYEILGRAYQINNLKHQLKQMGIRCAQKFNNSQNTAIFQQMVRISMTGALAKLSLQKSKHLLNCLQKTSEQKPRQQQAFEDLMQMANQIVVMQKFIQKIDGIQRIWLDISGKRAISNDSREFLRILANVNGIIGEQFIVGLVQQKEYQ